MTTKQSQKDIKVFKDLSKLKEAKKYANIDNSQRDEDGELIAIPKKSVKTVIDTKIEEKVVAKKRGKKITKAKNLFKLDVEYSITEGLKNLKSSKFSKFDETVEIHLNLYKAGLKGEVEMPNSIGKIVKVGIVSEELISEIESGVVNFDILITHPSFMPKLAKFARILGPKGLMPSPKTGTISENPEQLAEKLQGNLLKWKSESKFPIIHQSVGKLSFESNLLAENISAFVESVGKQNIKSAFLSSTMTPGFKLLTN